MYIYIYIYIYKESERQRESLVWFNCLMSYQLLMGYLQLNFDSNVSV